MSPQSRLLAYGAAVLALNALVLTPIAVLANLPSQFGGAGTDAAAELVSRGTAISAPAVTLAVLGLLLVLLRREGAWAAAGVIGTGLVGVLFVIGALGEAFAAPTPDVSKAVLLAAGLGMGALGSGMVALAALALARRPATRPPGPHAAARL